MELISLHVDTTQGTTQAEPIPEPRRLFRPEQARGRLEIAIGVPGVANREGFRQEVQGTANRPLE